MPAKGVDTLLLFCYAMYFAIIRLFQEGKQLFSAASPGCCLFNLNNKLVMLKCFLGMMSLIVGVNSFAQTDSTNNKRSLDSLVVSAVLAKPTYPVTQINLSRAQIKQRYYGADIPTLLCSTPSFNAYSDNGTGIGYSAYRLRGLDATRINFTINGIPVNDPENQGVFTNNFADLASSAQSIQVQRGVGTSSNGTASFAGSIHVQTQLPAESSQVEINTGVGSFNSRRLTANYHTGLLAGKVAFYGRISQVSTDGYRKNSAAEINSMQLSAAYYGKKNRWLMNIIDGHSKSQLSYLGVDEKTYKDNRKSNPFTQGEQDAFKQTFYQLQWTNTINKYSSLSASAYYVRSNAPQFENYFAAPGFTPLSYFNLPDVIIGQDTIKDTDVMASYRLNQHFYGAFINYFYQKKNWMLQFGTHVNSFSSDHFMEVKWARVLPGQPLNKHQAYFNTGYKTEASGFAKINYNLSSQVHFFADMQLRHTSFKYKGKDLAIRRDDFLVEDMQWLFFNPKVGFRYDIKPQTSIYLFAGSTRREPTRFDYFQDDFATRNVKQNDIKPEQVLDIEAGIDYVKKNITIHANVFMMKFTNQILNTGQINSFGYSTTTNVPSSQRNGIEFSIDYTLNKFISFTHNSMFSVNTIKEIKQFYTKEDFTDTAIVFKHTTPALTPSVIINQGMRLTLSKGVFVEAIGRYVSEQYLDNTENRNALIESFWFVDTQLAFSLKQWVKIGEPSVSMRVNNITNQLYAPSGSIAYGSNTINNSNQIGTSPAFFAAASRNFFVTLTYKF